MLASAQAATQRSFMSAASAAAAATAAGTAAAANAGAGGVRELLDFGIGKPCNAHLPYDLVAQASRRAYECSDGDAARKAELVPWLQYGTEQGDPAFRESLARFLSRHHGDPVDARELFLTGGVSHGIDLVCNALLKPNDVILVDDPTYFLVVDIFRQRHLRIVPVPVDLERGPRLDAVERLLREHRPKLLYTIPTANNPAAWTMNEADRRRLVALAEEHGTTILADEVYHLLPFEGLRHPTPMAHLSPRVISASSFSKILCPGIRVGWLQCRDEAVVRRLNDDAVTNSGGSISHFATAVVAQVLERDQGRAFDAYLAHLRQLYKRHCAALCAALRRHMPQCSFLEPTGGYFLWLRLPPSTRVSARQLAKVARAHFGVGFRHGAQCGVDTSGDVFDSALRLCFAHLPEPQLDEAVRRLAAAVAAVETEAAKD